MKKIYFIIMIVLGFCSCNKEISDTVTSPAEVDVYVAGFVADDVSSYYSYPYSPSYSFTSSLHEKPTYWKNGSLVEIDSGSYGNNGYIGARALSIAVSGNNVYVAGFLTGWSPYRNPVPSGIYWENGIKGDVFTRSGSPEYPYELSSLLVSNNKVYMVGWFAGFNATYYKNDSTIDLADGSTASSIAVSGNDVYVCGEEFNGTKNVAVYWKNDNRVNLTDGSKDAAATSIAVSGTDVYVCGEELNGAKNIAVYWKNGNRVNLTDGSKDAAAISIAVSGTDVYVAGTEYIGAGTPGSPGIAKYWKNGNPINLTDGSKGAYATSIAVSGNDVYVAGFENGVAKYWKNSSPVILGDVSKHSEAWSIFLTKK